VYECGWGRLAPSVAPGAIPLRRAHIARDGGWRHAYAAGVDIIVNGYDHLYERFAPQDPDGFLDPVHGIRQFTVGTGGAPLYDFVRIGAGSEVRIKAFGVLKLTLSAEPTGGNSSRFPEQAILEPVLPLTANRKAVQRDRCASQASAAGRSWPVSAPTS